MQRFVSRRSNWRRRERAVNGISFACACLGAAWMVPVVLGQLPATQLTAVFPPGGKAGTAVEVRIAGADQEEGTHLFFSDPGIVARPRQTEATEFEPARPQPGQFVVEIASGVLPGVYEARVAGRFGVSNPRAFVVDVHDEVQESGGNSQPSGAMALPLESTVNGTVDASQVDYYKLTLKAGQRVILDCRANRIDSRLVGAFVLCDPDGRELVRHHSAIGGDPLLHFTAPRDGDYRVGLHDFTYRGGGDYFYRLTAHGGPHIDFIFPPSGLPGSQDSYVIFGRNLPGGQPADGLILQGAPLERLQVQIPLPADDPLRRSLEFGEYVRSTGALLDGTAYRLGSSHPVTVHFAKAPVVAETEPNNQASQSQKVSFPCEVVGQFYPAQDVDYFEFEAKKGEVYNIEVISHQLGLPTDPLLVVTKVTRNDKGEEVVRDVAQVDDPPDRNNRIGGAFDTSTDDPEYRLTADEDAVYRVMVRDQFGVSRSDPRMLYRLAIHRGEPDLRLVAVPQPLVAPATNTNAVALGGVSVRQGGSAPIEVRVERRYGFAGDVEVAVEGLPPGVSCPPILIGANARTGSLVATALDTAAAWAGTIRIMGNAKSGDRELVRYARSGVAVWNSANRQQEAAPYRVTRDLAFGVIDRDPQPVFVQAAEDKIWETSRGGKLEIPIRVTRRDGFNEELVLAPADVPNELKPPNLTLKGGESEGKLQFAATNGNAKPGVYTFHLRADTKMSHKRNPHAVAALEQEQKEIVATIARLTEQSKQANETKTNAPKLVDEAVGAVTQAEQEKATAMAGVAESAEQLQVIVNALAATRVAAVADGGNKGLSDAVSIVERAKAATDAAKLAAEQRLAAAQTQVEQALTRVQAAKDAVVVAEKTAADAETKVKAAEQAKVAIDKRLEGAKTANKPRNTQFAVVSTPIRVRIVETCLELTVASSAPLLKAGGKLEVPITIQRMYGFDDVVEITCDLPRDAKGISTAKLTIAKEQTEGMLEISASAEATPGELQVSIRAKGRFNNIEMLAAQPMTLKIEAP